MDRDKFIDAWNSLSCGMCEYFSHDGSKCKRIDHKTIQFAIPWFKSYDCGQISSPICRDFIPSTWITFLSKEWIGFDEYYGNDIDKGLVPLCLDEDQSVRYYVKRKDWNDNTFKTDKGLKWIKKCYYKRSNKSPIGYELVTELNHEFLK